MGIRVALHHTTSYRYDRAVALSPHEVRLRPAPHSRTPVLSYSLSVLPTGLPPRFQEHVAPPTVVQSPAMDLIGRCRELAAVSEEAGLLSRPFATPARFIGLSTTTRPSTVTRTRRSRHAANAPTAA